MTRNLGSTSLKCKRRSADPMRSYDALPASLRHWLAQATLPWSPTSARRVWNRACAKGLSPEDAISALSQAEARTLARDRFSIINHLPTNT
ncbi:DUF6525 family protein [Yoonia sp. R2-816]|uniref:DUF6525 family protein n=1 Tax=Yoonia sp. R2-816 TaxID=3342638 RepID=UPI00372AA08A